MKKIMYQFFIAMVCYFVLTFMYSCVFGDLHFGFARAVGYPVVYYEFDVDGGKQFGLTKFTNFLLNIVVICVILALYRWGVKNFRFNKRTNF